MEADLVEFLRKVAPIHIFEAAGELHALSQNGANWPRASAEHWKRELEKLVKDGTLDEVDGMLSIAKVKRDAPRQGTLF
ncbi:hypothetical protein VN12_04140 [Pirellula sp. SH-Sr6A]|uniref:hypothetical protein n=1 Tax=Pirellula sp. SH-Sr6A TaxID=1632865 RepID=UPI00078CD85A|nr:hypothetical protein [Pirellula sp. SH-Sr6A]AMV31283.1 hypothetical protein VN12_04140 [Pirellula sp. SH-Sr6A]